MASNYKNFVEILPEKADNWRNFCICIACRDVNGRPSTLLQKFPFKTERVKNHLKKCQHFKNKYPKLFAEFFLSEVKSENVMGTNRLRRESTGSVNSSITSISWNSMCSFISIINNYAL